MPEQLLNRRSEAPRVTLKVQRLAHEPASSPWPKRLLLLLAVAVGGALLGQLGSALVSRLLSGNSSGGAGSTLTRAATLNERLGEIDALLMSRDSGSALVLIDDALTRFPSDPQLNALRRRAEEELKNRFRYQAFEQLLAKRNFGGALALFEELSADSPYRQRAAQELPALRSRHIAEQFEAGQMAAKLGQCPEVKLIAARIQAIEPSHSGARELIESCAGDGQAARRP
jgi:hypothetical protein